MLSRLITFVVDTGRRRSTYHTHTTHTTPHTPHHTHHTPPWPAQRGAILVDDLPGREGSVLSLSPNYAGRPRFRTTFRVKLAMNSITRHSEASDISPAPESPVPGGRCFPNTREKSRITDRITLIRRLKYGSSVANESF